MASVQATSGGTRVGFREPVAGYFAMLCLIGGALISSGYLAGPLLAVGLYSLLSFLQAGFWIFEDRVIGKSAIGLTLQIPITEETDFSPASWPRTGYVLRTSGGPSLTLSKEGAAAATVAMSVALQGGHFDLSTPDLFPKWPITFRRVAPAPPKIFTGIYPYIFRIAPIVLVAVIFLNRELLRNGPVFIFFLVIVAVLEHLRNLTSREAFLSEAGFGFRAGRLGVQQFIPYADVLELKPSLQQHRRSCVRSVILPDATLAISDDSPSGALLMELIDRAIQAKKAAADEVPQQ